MDVGWVVSKKAFTNFICRYTFDRACQELEMIYGQSQAEEGQVRHSATKTADKSATQPADKKDGGQTRNPP